MAHTAVLALGGNALTRESERGTIEEQYQNALAMAKSVRSLIRKKWGIVIVHGNGPQVGNLAIQHAESSALVPAQPLFALGAMTQGALGSLICLALHEVCADEISGAVSVVTHVEVDAADPAFQNPTKPIGPFYTAEQAEEMTESRGWSMIEDSGRGYRRVVASPSPKAPVEADAIRTLIDAGFVVVAAGGGGIPVVKEGSTYRGIDAVIDKDFAAERLADASDAEALVMVTGVANVKLDFGTPNERTVYNLTPDEVAQHMSDGQFPPGSMGPKMKAASHFVEGSTPERRRIAAVTTPEMVYATLDNAHGAIQGHRGTLIKHPKAVPADDPKEAEHAA
ncbi:MAG: carbamate kinase [Ilumatobacter sp.]|uniref:carbamate kinase n=1 Tax=Ilumatobacter sp. TaxID=1967498 RepID=UPI003918E373